MQQYPRHDAVVISPSAASVVLLAAFLLGLLGHGEEAGAKARRGSGRRVVTAPGGVMAGAVIKKGSQAWKRRNPFVAMARPAGQAGQIGRAGRAGRAGTAGTAGHAGLASRSARPVITVRNLHTGDLLAVVEGETPAPALVNRLLRCRWTGREAAMEPRLVQWILEAARHFGSREAQVVSAYRHSKFNEVLRKKGHEVARRSMHRLGQAVDFRLVDADVTVEALVAHLRGRRLGGVGRYPHSRFVHLDTGPVRHWGGQ